MMPALEPAPEHIDERSPTSDWRVLPSGALARQLPPTKEGKPIWLDALLGVKLCEHGHSAAQISHWRCTARPRAKPEWVTCTCSNAKGLWMEYPSPPADVPAYHRVLWRDATPVLLQPGGRMGVRVPGKPKGHDVFLAADGTPLCAHGFSACQIKKRCEKQRKKAASMLQAWWRAISTEARASVRAAMIDVTAARAVSPSRDLRRAAAVWRNHSEWRRVIRCRSIPGARPRGRPPARAKPMACSCTTAGLRLGRFQGEACGKRKRQDSQIRAPHRQPLISIGEHAHEPCEVGGPTEVSGVADF